MENEGILVLESDWLPKAELDRLVGEYHNQYPELAVSSTAGSEHRGLDPTIAVAIISGIFTVLVPFVTKLADRIFKQEPDAYVIIGEPGDKDRVVLRASLPAKARTRLLQDALSSKPLKVRISLEPPDA